MADSGLKLFYCFVGETNPVKKGIFRGHKNIGWITKRDRDMKKSKSYQKTLIESLKDTSEAAAYLNAVLEEGDSALFLLALRNVAEARGGMASLSAKAKMNRESLYRTLSKHGNPELSSLEALLEALGLRLSIEVSLKKAS